MLYKQIEWWPDAYHVFAGEGEEEERIGIVNRRQIRLNGVLDRTRWFAHNKNFFTVPGEYTSRSDAAAAIPRGPIHQPVDAFSGRSDLTFS